MAELSTSGVVRDLPTGDPEMPTDEGIRRARARGPGGADRPIRKALNNHGNPNRARGRPWPPGTEGRRGRAGWGVGPVDGAPPAGLDPVEVEPGDQPVVREAEYEVRVAGQGRHPAGPLASDASNPPAAAGEPEFGV